eukprot:GSA25T00015799001.1
MQMGGPNAAQSELVQQIVAKKRNPNLLKTYQQYYRDVQSLIHFCDYEVASVRQT